MTSILKLTYHEYVNRKVFIVSIILYGLVILALLFGIGKNTHYLINPFFLSFLFYFSLIFLLFSGFDLIPRMIEDGSIELLLSRPISRIRLLIYKYVSTLLIIPICSLLFFLIISIVYFIKTGIYDFIFIRIFVFTSITFAIYYASVLTASLLSYRSNLNLLICLVLIMSNVLPSLINRITIGHIELRHNYFIGFFHAISPRLVELCGLAVKDGNNPIIIFTHSAVFVLICLVLSFTIINRKDF